MRLLLCAAFALLLSAGTCAAQESAPEPNHLFDVMMLPASVVVPPAPAVLSQSDPRWNHARLGYSTIGKQGCFVTVLAMILNVENPMELAAKLRSSGSIDSRGRVYTQNLEALFPLKIIARQALRGDRLGTIQEWLGRGMYVLVHSGNHWQLATHDDQGKLVMNDPSGGKQFPLEDLHRVSTRGEILVMREQ